MTDPSYPPLFRVLNADDSLPSSPPDPTPAADIPTVDLQDLEPRLIGEACREWGLFRLSNHGIPPPLSARLIAEAASLLSLPFKSKCDQFPSPPVSYFWGTPAVTQKVSSLNWVEGLHIPFDNNGAAEGDDHAELRHLVEEYGRHMARIARALFEAMSIDLKLDADESASYLSEFDGMLRVYRYPCCPRAGNYFGMDAHTDSSVMSILNQDEVGGLQLLHDNEWLDLAPVPDTLVVNTGDMMQAISDDNYKSVEHRVLSNASKERISLCYFAFPFEDGVIMSSKYKAFTYKEFRTKVQEDIKATGYKVGLKRFLRPLQVALEPLGEAKASGLF